MFNKTKMDSVVNFIHFLRKLEVRAVNGDFGWADEIIDWRGKLWDEA